jgi:molybdopterin converting factor small subunit
MAKVWIPSVARELTNGKTVAEADGATVSEVLKNLDQIYPGFRDAILQGNVLRPSIVLAVDGTIGSRQLLQSVTPDSEIHLIPAIFGG